MSEKLIEKEKLRLPPGDGTTNIGEIMQLPESPGERGFPSLIGAGDDQNPLSAFQVKVIAYDSGTLADKLVGQRDIETVAILNFLALVGDQRVTERQSDTFQRGAIFKIGDIELDLAVESRDGPVHESLICRAEVA